MKWPFSRNKETDLGLSVDRSDDQKANFRDAFGELGDEKYRRWRELHHKYQKTPEERTELVSLAEIAHKYRE